jgi:hypothetical protein
MSSPRRLRLRLPVLAVLALLAGAPAALGSVDRFWNEIPAADDRPLSRSETSGIYDPVRDRLVFFGGLRGDPLAETWTYDFATGVWTQHPRAILPRARTNHAAVYDPTRDRMVIYGGEFFEDDELTTFQDTWALDLATMDWTELFTVGSFPKTNMVSAYDAARDRLWVALGFEVTAFSTTVGFLDFATGTWTLAPNVGMVPEQRIGAMGTIDPARDRLVVYGGNDRDDYYDDTFELDLETFAWHELPLPEVRPSRRAFGSTLLDATRNRMLVFGGNRDGDFYSETWAFTLDNDRWTRLEIDDEFPSSRNTALFIHDTLRDRFVIFAGQKRSERRNDLWELVDRAGGTGSGTLRANGNLAPADMLVSRDSRLDLDVQGRLDAGARYVIFVDPRSSGTETVLPGAIPFCFEIRPASPGFVPGTAIVCDTVGVNLSSGPLAGLDPPLVMNCPPAAAAPDFTRAVSGAVVRFPSGRSFTLQALVRDPLRAGGYGGTPAIRVTVR